MIGEIIAKKLINDGVSELIKALKKKKGKLISSKEDIEKAIQLHVKSIHSWSEEISFYGLINNKPTIGTYLNLSISPEQRRLSEAKSSKNIIGINKLFSVAENHIIILGDPGGGKTTTMRFLCQKVIRDENFHSNLFSFPIRFRLREFNNRSSDPPVNPGRGVIFRLRELLSIEIRPSDNPHKLNSFHKNLILEFVDSLKILLILDGLDELSDESERRAVLDDIQEITTNFTRSRLVVTSRIGDFHYNFPKTTVLEICPLSNEQVRKFASKWLKNKEKCNEFITQVKTSPLYDTLLRPLNLAQLCALFERDGKIPDKPKSTYRKIVELLIEKWDAERRIIRKSNYARFEPDRKFEFLCHLAYTLTVTYKKTIFSSDELNYAYCQICKNFALPPKETNIVIEEIESHNGLFVKSGVDSYEFSHKSLQEYLTAEYLVKLPFLPNNSNHTKEIPNELAIAVSLSSNPSIYFAQIVLYQLRLEIMSAPFLPNFIDRILLEKPEFYRDPFVGVAYLYLYGLTKKRIMPDQKSNSQDIVIRLYEKSNGIRESVQEVFKFFRVENLDDQLYVRLVQENTIPTDFDFGKKYVPSELSCHHSFLEPNLIP